MQSIFMNFAKASRLAFARGVRPRLITSPSPYFRQSGQKPATIVTMEGSPRFQRPAIFICDLQEKFRGAIWQFDKVLLTAQKLLRAADILQIPVFITTQYEAKLGSTVAEVRNLIANTKIPLGAEADKTAFSMLGAPEIAAAFPSGGDQRREVVIVGIESHICVTQTSLDLLARGHKVYVLADGVSSCNPQEVPIALARLRAEGVIVTTSESWLYECMGDAAIPEFREMAKLVKETSGNTKTALAGLLGNV